MIGRADIEGSKSHVAMNAWRPQASYPCGNFSDTYSLKLSLLLNRELRRYSPNPKVELSQRTYWLKDH